MALREVFFLSFFPLFIFGNVLTKFLLADQEERFTAVTMD